MAGNWSYSPRYVLRLYKSDGSVWDFRGANSLQSAQYLLVTGAGVNQATFQISDPNGYIRRVVQPHAMNIIELWSENRAGQGGLCWRGYLDEVHRAFDPQQGDDVTLVATGPVKRFETTRQSAGQAAGLALAYAQNITGSAVLRYAAKACGYPASMLRIHPQADAASGFQSISTGVFTNPDNQTWSSVVSAIQANSGVEWFFDEGGYCYWRQVGFLDPWFGPSTPDRPRPTHIQPRRIDEEDIIHADFFESDKGIITRVEVRYYGGGGFTQTAEAWSAPTAMKSHLGIRTLIVPAPWIINATHAQYLAQVLGAQVSAGLAQAVVTLPLDPLITIGSLVDIPALGIDGTTRYYVSSVTGLPQWGGAWNMVLGLSYGRAPGRRFPYVGSVSYPVLTDQLAGESFTTSVQSLNADNPAWDETPYTVLASSALGPTDAQVPAYNVGAQIEVYSQPHSHGAVLGPAHHGLYTVVAPVQGQASNTIILQSTSASTGYVTIVDPGQDAQNDPTAGATPDNGVSGYDSTQNGTAVGSVPAVPSTYVGTGRGATLKIQAFSAALSKAGLNYQISAAGPTKWDCSGLVAWAYTQIGATGLIVPGAGGGGQDGDIGPDGLYYYFKHHGATDMAVEDTQPGDVIFIRIAGGPQRGFVHAGFIQKAGGFSNGGITYGANNPNDGIGSFPLSSYYSDWPGYPPTQVNVALNMNGYAP